MQEIAAWLIASFLTVASLVTGIGAKMQSMSKRSGKQDLNLAGRLVISYISQDPEGNMIIDEEAFGKELTKRLRSEDFLGVVISYPDRVSGITSEGRIFEEVPENGEYGSKKERKFHLDKVASQVVSSVQGEGRCVEIETVSSGNIQNGRGDNYFNDLGDTADIFLISKAGDNYVMSGFSLQFG